jgi:hypothetical protein
MDIRFIQIGINKLVWLEEYTDEINQIHYSEGYYIFPDVSFIELEASNIE